MLNQLMRYLPLAALVKATGCADVLDVGSGEEGISAYLPGMRVTMADPSFEKDSDDGRLRRVRASVLRLPFADGTFPAVVCSDMLEHIAAEDRPAAVRELLRVSADKVFLGFPVAESYSTWESRLLRWYRFMKTPVPLWLEDHMTIGLPSEKEVAGLLAGASFRVLKNENNVAHFVIMAIEASPLGKYLNRAASLAAPAVWDASAHGAGENLLRVLSYPLRWLPGLLGFGSTLRRIFVIEKRSAAANIADYYKTNPIMISSPFSGVGGALSRENGYFSETLEKLGIALEDSRVLDVGCGSGWFAYYCWGRGVKYTGVDISETSLEMTLKVSPNVLKADAQALPFQDRSFDYVFCIDSFEHVPDQAQAAREFNRVLVDKGRVFLSVPNYSNMAGLVKKLEEAFGGYEKDSWAPFDRWAPQALERFMTPGRVRRLFSEAGFSAFSVIGGQRDLLDGIFPWIDHACMPAAARVRELFSRVQWPLEGCYLLSLHNFWLIRKE